jgi:hypothetical protein
VESRLIIIVALIFAPKTWEDWVLGDLSLICEFPFEVAPDEESTDNQPKAEGEW